MARGTRDLYFALFVIQFVVGAALVIHGEVVDNEADGFLGSVRVIMMGLAPMAIGSAASAVSMTEIGRFIVVLSSRIMEAVRKMKEDRVATIERRREEGREEERAQWESWNARRLAAEAEGRPFDEPPPSAT